VPYRPPSGWVEPSGRLERERVFHEDPACPAVHDAAALVPADRPGRARECKGCVRHTAAAQLAS
jgi:hypothetical protein